VCVRNPRSPPNLLRFSIGLEDVNDLIADLHRAFDALPLS
jgi:cystathionine beta-lyase/cystathionine gamma-synthase